MDATQPGSGTSLQLRVGAFVLAGLLVFAGLVYMLGRSAGLFERQYRLVASFGQIGGLIQGATVRLAGVAVGHVGEIQLPEPGSAKVRVELLIARRVQDRIRADSLARIETLGLLGDKIIDVTLGSPGAAVLQDGGELRTEEPFDTARLTQQGAGSSATWSSSRRISGAPSRASPRAPPGRTSPRPCGRSGASRPRSSGGRASFTGSSTTGSSGRRSRTRARRSGRSARPCGGSIACSPIRARPGWPARRSGPLPRRGAPPSG